MLISYTASCFSNILLFLAYSVINLTAAGKYLLLSLLIDLSGITVLCTRYFSALLEPGYTVYIILACFCLALSLALAVVLLLAILSDIPVFIITSDIPALASNYCL